MAIFLFSLVILNSRASLSLCTYQYKFLDYFIQWVIIHYCHHFAQMFPHLAYGTSFRAILCSWHFSICVLSTTSFPAQATKAYLVLSLPQSERLLVGNGLDMLTATGMSWLLSRCTEPGSLYTWATDGCSSSQYQRFLFSFFSFRVHIFSNYENADNINTLPPSPTPSCNSLQLIFFFF